MFWHLLLWNAIGTVVFGGIDWITNRNKPEFSLQSHLIGYAASFAVFAVLGYFIRQDAILKLMFFLGPSFGSRIVKLISGRKQ